ENSEVLLAASVAVAVTNWPAATKTGNASVKLATPAPSVVTEVVPTYRSPSPEPEGSAAVLAKIWIRNVERGLPAYVPLTITPLAVEATEVKVGWFRRMFGPVAKPALLFGVTSFGGSDGTARLIPRAPLEKIELVRMPFPMLPT